MNKLILGLDREFARLHERSCALLEAIPADRLYWQPRAASQFFPVYSCGEHILRSAAAVEQTIGGITSNLWDDPFEWTLPETLHTPERVREHLLEVEGMRRRGFEFFRSDDELQKEIMTPAGRASSLFDLLLETLLRATHHQGRAFATFRLFSDARLPLV